MPIKNKQEQSKYFRKWYIKNKEKTCERIKNYKKGNPEKVRKWSKDYYWRNKKKIYEKYSKNSDFKYTHYKCSARGRNIIFLLTKDEFKSIWNKPCFYCTSHENINGIDRIDNTQGYFLTNCTPCCVICNKMKGKLSKSLFIMQAKRIANNMP